MPLSVAFWVVAIVALAFGFYTPWRAWWPGPIFLLVLILGWRVFGPAIH